MMGSWMNFRFRFYKPGAKVRPIPHAKPGTLSHECERHIVVPIFFNRDRRW